MERGLSENSIAAYRSDLEDFTGWLREQGKNTLPEVTRDDIIDFLGARKEQGMEPSSLARRLVAIKVLKTAISSPSATARFSNSCTHAGCAYPKLPP